MVGAVRQERRPQGLPHTPRAVPHRDGYGKNFMTGTSTGPTAPSDGPLSLDDLFNAEVGGEASDEGIATPAAPESPESGASADSFLSLIHI